VLGTIASKLGSNLEVSMVGAAPLGKELSEWVRATCNIPVYPVYGMTETFAGCIASVPPLEDPTSIGRPIGRHVVRLVSIPDMNYTVHDTPCPRGEIHVKGPLVFAGYFKNPEQTSEVILPEGWLATGDVARLNLNGTLTIIDRKRNLFKLAQGEFVAVEALEMAYSHSLLIQQIWVHGCSLDNFVVAVVVPEPDRLRAAANTIGIVETADMAELCKDPRVVSLVHKELVRVGKEQKLRGFEIVRDIILEPNPWTMADDLVTPTLKIKRSKLLTKYRDVVEALLVRLRSAELEGRSVSPVSKSPRFGFW
jgi:long-chain acyl-CoA synthetase